MTHASDCGGVRLESQVKRRRIIDAKAKQPRELERERPEKPERTLLTAKVFEFCLARQVARAKEQPETHG
jgi:hypothetical protein